MGRSSGVGDWRIAEGKGVKSIHRHRNVHQWPILLAAEDVGVARAAARGGAEDREFDRQCRLEFDPIADPALGNAKDAAYRSTGQHAAAPDEVVTRSVSEDHIKGDLVDPGILAADGLGDLGKTPRRHQIPASVRKVGNTSKGSSTRTVWFTVQR